VIERLEQKAISWGSSLVAASRSGGTFDQGEEAFEREPCRRASPRAPRRKSNIPLFFLNLQQPTSPSFLPFAFPPIPSPSLFSSPIALIKLATFDDDLPSTCPPHTRSTPALSLLYRPWKPAFLPSSPLTLLNNLLKPPLPEPSRRSMKSFTGTIALLGLLLSSSLSVEAQHDKISSRSRSHHNHIASALSIKSTTLLHKRATPSGWSLVGCVTEGTSGARALTGYSQQSLSSLTVESCLATCASMAYTYGGLECECSSNASGAT